MMGDTWQGQHVRSWALSLNEHETAGMQLGAGGSGISRPPIESRCCWGEKNRERDIQEILLKKTTCVMYPLSETRYSSLLH